MIDVAPVDVSFLSRWFGSYKSIFEMRRVFGEIAEMTFELAGGSVLHLNDVGDGREVTGATGYRVMQLQENQNQSRG